jgi:hypothetical protein
MLIKALLLIIIRRIHIILFTLIILWISLTVYQFSSTVENERTEFDQKISDLNVRILELLNAKNSLQKELFKLGELISYKQEELGRLETKSDVRTINEKNYTSLDSCFIFQKCFYNSKIKIFFINTYFKLEKKIDHVFEQVKSIDEACLVVYFIINSDEIEKDILKNVPDSNFLIVNTLNAQIAYEKDYKCLLYASYGYDSLNHISNNRHNNLFFHFSTINLDLSESLDQIDKQQKYFRLKFTHTRKYLLTYYKQDDKKINFNSDFNEINCEFDSCSNQLKRLEYYSNSTFLLIDNKNNHLLWSNLMTEQLIEGLSVGTIPLFLDLDSKLPLNDLINWNEIIVRVPKHEIQNLDDILYNFNQADIIDRRIRGNKIYNRYFKTPEIQFNTLITAIRERIRLPAMPIQDFVDDEVENYQNITEFNVDMKFYMDKSTQINSNEYLGPVYNNGSTVNSEKFQFNMTFYNYFTWNVLFYPFNIMPSTPFDKFLPIDLKYTSIDEQKSTNNLYGGTLGGNNFPNKLRGNHDDNEQFTIIVLTYNRERLLISVLIEYFKLPYLNQIIVVWNSEEKRPTNAFYYIFQKQFNMKLLRIVFGKGNSLGNRFLPYNLIRTDAVLSLDDDTQLKNDEIIFGFRVWRDNRDRLVGYPTRFHSWNPNNHEFSYKTEATCEYSLILTGAAFYHRFYHYYYHYLLDERIIDKIDEFKNCEDIAFNFMISDLTRKPSIRVTGKAYFYCKLCATDKTIEKSLSSKHIHYERRTACVNYFSLIFGYNPLLYSQSRMDSILYDMKSKSRDFKKCFVYV